MNGTSSRNELSNPDAPLINGFNEWVQLMLKNRHTSVRQAAQFLDNSHHPPRIQGLTDIYASALSVLLRNLDDSPVLTTAINKLVESKDYAVRQLVVQEARDA